MNGRELSVARVVDEATERASGAAWSDLEPCRCWTEPARVHQGHCCMAEAGQTCHQDEGMTALVKLEDKGGGEDKGKSVERGASERQRQGG